MPGEIFHDRCPAGWPEREDRGKFVPHGKRRFMPEIDGDGLQGGAKMVPPSPWNIQQIPGVEGPVQKNNFCCTRITSDIGVFRINAALADIVGEWVEPSALCGCCKKYLLFPVNLHEKIVHRVVMQARAGPRSHP